MKSLPALALVLAAVLAVPAHAEDPHAGHQAAQTAEVMAMGTLDKVGQGQEVILSHDPIPALGWPAMTMPFTLAAGVSAQGIKPGSKVHFMLKQTGPTSYEITSIQAVNH